MRDFAISDHPGVQAQLDRLAALSLPQGRIGLEAVGELLARLGDPQDAMPPVFHVAGTNGKGSTCAFLRAMLEAEGLKVHATTSPHLARYNERIRIAGKLISDKALADILAEVLDAAEGLQVSFFETTIAASFLAFARTPADACVIEVGLGGRFDATNVIARPAVCGIASLGIDHERFLLAPEDGVPEEPLARIAFEKAGIAKIGVPLVTQDYPSEATKAVIDTAMKVGARTAIRDLDWSARIDEEADDLIYRDARGGLRLPLPNLPGSHQIDNAALAVAMLRHQDVVPVSSKAIAKGITKAKWPARMQWLKRGPLTRLAPNLDWLLDGGHNPDAAQAISAYLTGRGKRAPVHAVIGMIAGKDWRTFIDTLSPNLSTVIAIPVPGHDSVDPAEIAGRAKENGIGSVGKAPDLASALRQIGAHTQFEMAAGSTLLIGGSLYLAGEVLRLNKELPD